MAPDVEDIVRSHYDPAASRDAKEPLFMVETHSSDANHTLELLDADEFTWWLYRTQGRSVSVDQINQVVNTAPSGSTRRLRHINDGTLVIGGLAILFILLLWLVQH